MPLGHPNEGFLWASYLSCLWPIDSMSHYHSTSITKKKNTHTIQTAATKHMKKKKKHQTVEKEEREKKA
jgi:hypothetical protein